MDTGRLEINGSAKSEWIMDLLDCYAKEYQEDVRSGKAAMAMADNLSFLPNVKNRKHLGPLIPSLETPSDRPPASPLVSKSRTALRPNSLGGKF